jgi:DMSO reductase anchor subunit
MTGIFVVLSLVSMITGILLLTGTAKCDDNKHIEYWKKLVTVMTAFLTPILVLAILKIQNDIKWFSVAVLITLGLINSVMILGNNSVVCEY